MFPWHSCGTICENLLIKKLLLVYVLLTAATVNAQQSAFKSWFFLNHQQKIAGKLSLLADIQIRSGPRSSQFDNVLLRPGLLYGFSEKHEVGLGYTWFASWDHQEQDPERLDENRIWEQYTLSLDIGMAKLDQRLRLEQRFIDQDSEEPFSQRLRYYVRAKRPFEMTPEFTQGLFGVLQNELFLNVQHKDRINGSHFDQNRIYGSIGYRFSKKIDVEMGYILRHQLAETWATDHILQVILSTSF